MSPASSLGRLACVASSLLPPPSAERANRGFARAERTMRPQRRRRRRKSLISPISRNAKERKSSAAPTLVRSAGSWLFARPPKIVVNFPVIDVVVVVCVCLSGWLWLWRVRRVEWPAAAASIVAHSRRTRSSGRRTSTAATAGAAAQVAKSAKSAQKLHNQIIIINIAIKLSNDPSEWLCSHGSFADWLCLPNRRGGGDSRARWRLRAATRAGAHCSSSRRRRAPVRTAHQSASCATNCTRCQLRAQIAAPKRKHLLSAGRVAAAPATVAARRT